MRETMPDMNDDQLDALLREACWPEPDGAADARLRARLDAAFADDARQTTSRPARLRPAPVAWTLAAAAAVAGAATLWLAWPEASKPATPPVAVKPEVKPAPPAVESPAPEPEPRPAFASRPAEPWEVALAAAMSRPAAAPTPAPVVEDERSTLRATIAAHARGLASPVLTDRESAARSLARIDDPLAADALARALDDPAARRPVLQALSLRPTFAAQSLLERAGRDPALAAQLRSVEAERLTAASLPVVMTNPTF